jgi:hypothetical protein
MKKPLPEIPPVLPLQREESFFDWFAKKNTEVSPFEKGGSRGISGIPEKFESFLYG